MANFILSNKYRDMYSYLWISMQHESKATLLKIKLALYNEYESEEILVNSHKYKRIICIYISLKPQLKHFEKIFLE